MSTSMTRKQRQDRIKELSSDSIILGRNSDTVHKLLFEEILIVKLKSWMPEIVNIDNLIDDLIHFSNMEAYSELRELEKNANEKFEKRMGGERMNDTMTEFEEACKKVATLWQELQKGCPFENADKARVLNAIDEADKVKQDIAQREEQGTL